MSTPVKFMDRAVSGLIPRSNLRSALLDSLSEWHQHGCQVESAEWLGMTKDEWILWEKRPWDSTLISIVNKRIKVSQIDQVLSDKVLPGITPIRELINGVLIGREYSLLCEWTDITQDKRKHRTHCTIYTAKLPTVMCQLIEGLFCVMQYEHGTVPPSINLFVYHEGVAVGKAFDHQSKVLDDGSTSELQICATPFSQY